ncbi:MAG: hypothetical protein ACR2PL_00640 [Dehalococcoidia bacterium]
MNETIEKSEKTERAFEPSRYLTKLPKRARQADGAWGTVETDYLEVKWRLLWLRSEHPDAVIESELVSHADEMAVFRARVSIPSGGSSTGWGHETAADFGEYLEKAETKALGRALAALGYGTQFCEDFDFAQGDERRVVDAPVDRGSTRGAASAGGSRPQASNVTAMNNAIRRSGTGGSTERPVLLATEPQVKAIFAIGRGAQGLDDAELDARCRERYGCAPQELTRRQASEFIDALKLGAAGTAS